MRRWKDYELKDKWCLGNEHYLYLSKRVDDESEQSRE